MTNEHHPPSSTSDDLPDEHPVARQFAAYNRHHLDDFVACFTPTIRVTRGDGSVRAEGLDRLREVYAAVLAVPGRRAEILNRIAVGDRVVDHELVSDASGHSFEAIVAYRIEGDLISEMSVLT